MLPALPTYNDLDAAADPAHFVIASCERAKSWLAQCLEGNHIEAIVETKAQAEAIRVYTMQKQLGKDAELSACEIVRRAERCIGLAIRRGQEEGRIAKRGDIGGRNSSELDVAKISDVLETAPGRAHDVSHMAYSLTDGISDEAFDAAISTAKAEGNLSRKNLVRKINGAPGAANAWARLESLIAEGHTSDQIARKLGFHRSTVVSKAAKLGLRIVADDVTRGTRRLNHERMLREFVATLESLTPSCDLIDAAKVNTEARVECIEIMDEVMRTLAKFLRRLRKEGES